MNVVTNRSPNTPDLVRSDRRPDASAANHQTKLGLARPYFLNQTARDVGKIDRLVIERTNVVAAAPNP